MSPLHVVSLINKKLKQKCGDGYENVTKKVNSHCFEFYRAHSVSFNSSNFGEVF